MFPNFGAVGRRKKKTKRKSEAIRKTPVTRFRKSLTSDWAETNRELVLTYISLFKRFTVLFCFFTHTIYNVDMSFPGSFGKLLSPLLATTNHLVPLRTLKSRIQTQMSEMDKCHLCQRPTQKDHKTQRPYTV